jgi:transposase
MQNACFDSDLTDSQWQLLEPHLPPSKPLGRPRTPLRFVVNALLYMAKTGCQWRSLPHSFPPYQTVFHIFRDWQKRHLWAALNDRLRARVREDEDKASRPTAAILDSQTVRSSPHGGVVGYDAAKKVKGRKRFLLVDTLGMVLGALVKPAHLTERAGAMALLGSLLPWFPWLRKLWVDGGYSGEGFAQWVKSLRPKLEVEVVKRTDPPHLFKILPRRWVAERTFGWLMQNRRLVRDHEATESSAIAWIYIAMIRLMVRGMG